jgi:hypothetical protein
MGRNVLGEFKGEKRVECLEKWRRRVREVGVQHQGSQEEGSRARLRFVRRVV